MEITIDNEFKTIIPALTRAEFEQLEKNILNEGCREKIITWNNTLIDGHNRHSICTKHSLPFEVQEMNHFANRHEVIDWMIHNQIGKRNLSGSTISYLRGLKLKREKQIKLAEAGLLETLEEQVTTDAVTPSSETTVPQEEANNSEERTQSDAKEAKEKEFLEIKKAKEESVAKEVAELYQISPATLKKDEKFTEAIDTIRENTTKEIQDKILSKELKLNPLEVMSISKMESEKQKELMSGTDDVILEKLAEVKREKQQLNQKKVIIKLEQKLEEIQDENSPYEYMIADSGEEVSLLQQLRGSDSEQVICTFKGAKKLEAYLEGFIDAIKLLSDLN